VQPEICPFLIAEHHAAYLRRFGAAPSLRAGIHAGPLIIGEMGDVKREIVTLGDTMNTASRVESACRGPVGPPSLRADNIGSVVLRGKSAARELYALALA
jgi:adenylate cyclase